MRIAASRTVVCIPSSLCIQKEDLESQDEEELAEGIAAGR